MKLIDTNEILISKVSLNLSRVEFAYKIKIGDSISYSVGLHYSI